MALSGLIVALRSGVCWATWPRQGGVLEDEPAGGAWAAGWRPAPGRGLARVLLERLAEAGARACGAAGLKPGRPRRQPGGAGEGRRQERAEPDGLGQARHKAPSRRRPPRHAARRAPEFGRVPRPLHLGLASPAAACRPATRRVGAAGCRNAGCRSAPCLAQPPAVARTTGSRATCRPPRGLPHSRSPRSNQTVPPDALSTSRPCLTSMAPGSRLSIGTSREAELLPHPSVFKPMKNSRLSRYLRLACGANSTWTLVSTSAQAWAAATGTAPVSAASAKRVRSPRESPCSRGGGPEVVVAWAGMNGHTSRRSPLWASSTSSALRPCSRSLVTTLGQLDHADDCRKECHNDARGARLAVQGSRKIRGVERHRLARRLALWPPRGSTHARPHACGQR